ncbi:MAG: dTMP kinase [Candidatus Omnitrophica bacterium]|nr:dTMP kinase [Candidatus Omnitrophota bacterium]
MKGIFVTFEGSEGSGKSTHSKMLCDYLRREGREVLFAREPGSTFVGEQIRKALLSVRNKSMSANCELMLYMAARAQIVDELIIPALKKGAAVVCDRFLDSTLAYQGYGLGMDLSAIRHMGKLVTRGIRPDITFFLDVEVNEGLRRAGSVKDRIELRPLAFHRRVRAGYLKLAKAEPGRVKVIKVDHNKEQTQEAIRKQIDDLIKKCHLRT